MKFLFKISLVAGSFKELVSPTLPAAEDARPTWHSGAISRRFLQEFCRRLPTVSLSSSPLLLLSRAGPRNRRWHTRAESVPSPPLRSPRGRPAPSAPAPPGQQATSLSCPHPRPWEGSLSTGRRPSLANLARARAHNRHRYLSPGKEAGRFNAECASGEWVGCANGMSNGQRCEEACDGLCCRGTNACSGFTGDLCGDDVTCIGDYACWDAKIDFAAGGCSGKYACDYAGAVYWGGSLGKVHDACHGERACSFAAYKGGTINEIVNSCKGYEACAYAAAWNGNIPNILNSCNEEKACSGAGGHSGGIGGIQNSCNNVRSCYRAGNKNYTGPISWMMVNCCNGEEQCKLASEI